jgi:hypothetical protein
MWISVGAVAGLTLLILLANRDHGTGDGEADFRPLEAESAIALAEPLSRVSPADASPLLGPVATCDHLIGPTEDIVGTDLDLHAGDVICLAEGTRGPLRIEGVVGEPERPIVVVNRGSVTIQGSAEDYAGITVTKSAEIRITGAGGTDVRCGAGVPVAEQTCGLLIRGSARGVAGSEGTTGITIDHVEITATTNSGIFIRTKPDAGFGRGEFVQERTGVHASYFHDIGTEGLYLGSSSYHDDANPVLVGVSVTHNLVIDSGWDGIQVGSAVEACGIHWNTVVLPGSDNRQHQHSGIIANRGSVCDITHNVVVSPAAQGVFVQGNGDNLVSHNLIVGAGARNPDRGDGITIRTGSNVDGSIQVVHNTIVDAARYGVLFENQVGTENEVSYNLIVDPEREALSIRPSNVREVGNVESSSDAGLFVDPAHGLFLPTPRSSAILDDPVPIVGEGTTDLAGVPIGAGGRTSAGALEPVGSA